MTARADHVLAAFGGDLDRFDDHLAVFTARSFDKAELLTQAVHWEKHGAPPEDVADRDYADFLEAELADLRAHTEARMQAFFGDPLVGNLKQLWGTFAGLRYLDGVTVQTDGVTPEGWQWLQRVAYHAYLDDLEARGVGRGTLSPHFTMPPIGTPQREALDEAMQDFWRMEKEDRAAEEGDGQ